MDSWSTYQNLPPDQVNWADLAQRWMAMRSAQDEQRPGGELNGYGGHFGSDVGPPPSHFGRGGGYEYGRGDPGGLYHHGHDQNYPRGPPERNHRDYELHDTFRQDDWSSPPSGPNRPIFPSAAQTKGDIRNDFQDNYRGDWGAVPPPPPCPRDPPELYRPPGPASNQYFQHDFPPCPSPSARNWGSQHPPGPPIRGGPPVGAPPLPNGPPLHGLPPSAGPPLKSSSPSGGPPPSGGSGPGPWYPTPFYPPPFTSGVSNNNISSQHQSGSSQSSAPSFFTMDASTRKKLPAWILEGLEKAEREKMKQLEKEERMKRAEEERAKRRVLAGKGRFDSSSEDEDDGQADDERSRTKSRQSCDANDDDGEPVFLARRANPPVEDLRTDEEKRDDAMATVKFIMMSLLMEATDEAPSQLYLGKYTRNEA
ncbi:hypothetical protein KIN20_009983 [Parelaphostrongylus tenuis]|uniref:Uncharacterized protein n=1 Tax=Parelaphostrongylus tenuis TaxID=148309 RepID=A0AAD5MPX5_PARTN|nr:hypothetical protein KIN20_009983 [Parelaphostrongylus tenuis]